MYRAIPTITIALAAVVIAATPAWAHTEFQPASAEAGATVEFNLLVEDEQPDAATNKIELFFPESASVIVEDVPTPDGWSVTVVDGEVGTTATGITWEGGSEPDDVNFPISLTLPADAGRLQFKLIQTYDNGVIDRWIGDAATGAENPGPTIDLSAAGSTITTIADDGHEDHDHDAADATSTSRNEFDQEATVSDSDGDGSSSGGIVVVVLAVLALGGAGAFFVIRGRRR
jgi:MYXO-CTERM domain-containing protein